METQSCIKSLRICHTHYTHAHLMEKNHQKHAKHAAIQLQSNTLSQNVETHIRGPTNSAHSRNITTDRHRQRFH